MDGFRITSKEIWALVLAAAPFVLYFGSKTTVNGVVTSDFNYVGIGCGALAVIVAGYAAMTLKGDAGDKALPLHYGVLAVAAIVGAYQFLQGASII